MAADKKLVDGMRRIKAFELLGRSEIDVFIFPTEQVARGEHDANVFRKALEISEIRACIEAIHEYDTRPAAKARADAGRAKGTASTAGKGSSTDSVHKPSEAPKAFMPVRSIDQAAAQMGMSRERFQRVRAVCRADEEDTKKYGAIKEKMDKTGNVAVAYRLSGPLNCTVPHFPATI